MSKKKAVKKKLPQGPATMPPRDAGFRADWMILDDPIGPGVGVDYSKWMAQRFERAKAAAECASCGKSHPGAVSKAQLDLLNIAREEHAKGPTEIKIELTKEDAERVKRLMESRTVSVGYKPLAEFERLTPAEQQEVTKSVQEVLGGDKPVADKVNHPTHYNTGKIEVIEFIEDQHLGFNLGNALKYISRAGKKDPAKTVEDLEKAIWYARREIALLKGNPPRPNAMPQERAQ